MKKEISAKISNRAKNQFLVNNRLKFIVFGGKGGSGKTTCACATALYLGQKYKTKRILIVSTDPAPSIGDSFNVEVGNKITKIQDNIWAYEMEAKELMEDFRKQHSETIKILLDRGTYLDSEDIEQFTSLAMPGMDEVMAIIKIAELLEKEYDIIILDTAPTGHTKILLSLPQAMKRWIKAADLMMAKHRFIMKRIRRKYIDDECDKFLTKTLADIERVEKLLKNQETTEFVPVTIPEPMSILETEELVKDLDIMKISVKSIIANRMATVEGECSLCASRIKEKEKYLKMIEEKFSAKGGSVSGGKDYQILKMPLFPAEIRGQDSLNEYARILFAEKEFEIILPKKLPEFPEIPQGKMAKFLKKDLSFVICGGKGGVGKTSIAAATAMALAKKHKEKKILITTTDPAHALSNIFDQDIPLAAEAVSIRGFNNLFAIEIDTQKSLRDFKDEYKESIKELFNKFTGPGAEVVYDQQVMEELMELSPPGLEELMALRKVMDLAGGSKYDIYVLDSAASGHLLRFLELPGLVREWLKSIFKILRKYQGLKLEGIAQKTVNLSRDIRKIQKILFGSAKTEFLMITIPEEMGIREMEDLDGSLESMNINYNYIIANFINPASKCNFCLAKRKGQEKYLGIIKKQYPLKNLILVPLLPHDIRGIDSLHSFSKILYGI